MLLAMAGWAEGVAVQVNFIAALVLGGAWVLLLLGVGFRSLLVTWASSLICLSLAALGSSVAFAPPVESTDPEALHWDSADRALGWQAIGLGVASVGAVGLVTSTPRGRRPKLPTGLLWGLCVFWGAVAAAGTGLAVVKGSPCFWALLLLSGVTWLSLVEARSRQA
jgi:hypothetical protein